MMKVELKRELAQKVKELAIDLGMTEDEVVHQIIEWYFVDNAD